MALPGIGDAYADKSSQADRILEWDQLVSKKITPRATFDKLSRDGNFEGAELEIEREPRTKKFRRVNGS